MSFFVLLECWNYEGCAFHGLYTTLQNAINVIESHLSKSKHDYEIIQVEPDNPRLNKEIDFLEEAEWKCQCGAKLKAGISSEEQADFYELHREQLKHNVEFLGITGKVLL